MRETHIPTGRLNREHDFTIYDIKYLFTCLLEMYQKGTSWTHYEGPIFRHNNKIHKVSGKYLNSIHHIFINLGIYNEINRQLLNKYLEKDKEIKLKLQSIDSTFIANKGGSVKNNNYLLNIRSVKKNKKRQKHNKEHPDGKQQKYETFIDTNRYNGRKKYIKISRIVDSFGVPLTNTLISSKQSDAISVKETIESIPIELNTLRNSKVNRYKQNLLADSGYHSKKNIKYLKRKGYKPCPKSYCLRQEDLRQVRHSALAEALPIIKYNKRNTKDEQIIKKNTLSKKDEQVYKKRMIIESSFAWSKKNTLLNQNYQKSMKSYHALIVLDAIIRISLKI